MNEKRTYTLLVDIVTDNSPAPDARTLAQTLELVLRSYPEVHSAVVSGVEGDATHAAKVLAHLLSDHKARRS